MRMIKAALLVWIFATAPISLLSVGWGLKQLFLTAPVWLSVVVFLSLITTVLSFARLVDEARQKSGYQGE